jgi:hypothetical protein
MQYSGDQMSQINEAKSVGQDHILLQLTEAQKQEYQKTVEQEAATQGDNISHFRKIKLAAEQPGFFGDIRRAMVIARRPIDDLANEIGVSPQLLSSFRTGDADLPATALDLLVAALRLRLMQEIPR